MNMKARWFARKDVGYLTSWLEANRDEDGEYPGQVRAQERIYQLQHARHRALAVRSPKTALAYLHRSQMLWQKWAQEHPYQERTLRLPGEPGFEEAGRRGVNARKVDEMGVEVTSVQLSPELIQAAIDIKSAGEWHRNPASFLMAHFHCPSCGEHFDGGDLRERAMNMLGIDPESIKSTSHFNQAEQARVRAALDQRFAEWRNAGACTEEQAVQILEMLEHVRFLVAQ